MPAFTGQQLVNRAASVADQHDGFVTPEECLDWLNVEARALDVFCARHGWKLRAFAQTTVASAPYSITLPDETLALLGVWELTSDGRYRPLEHTDAVTSRIQDPLTGPDTGEAREFWTESAGDGVTVYLYPRPTSGTYVAIYLPSTARFTDLEDTATYPLGFEEWIVLNLALRMLVKEESDTRKVEDLILKEERKISEMGWQRQMAEVPKIRKQRRTSWAYEPLYPEVVRWHWL
jgi:hypothetical protein